MVERARLESVYTPKGYLGFESLTLRKKKKESGVALFFILETQFSILDSRFSILDSRFSIHSHFPTHSLSVSVPDLH